MSDLGDNIKLYKETMQELKDIKFTKEKIENIKNDLDFTENDEIRLKSIIDGYHKRGAEYLQQKKYNEAINELEKAYILYPINVHVVYILAKAYQSRWRQNLSTIQSDKNRADKLARRCIEIDPSHSSSYDIIKDLKKDIVIKPEKEKKKYGKKIILLISILLVLFLIILTLYLFKDYKIDIKKKNIAENGNETEDNSKKDIIEYSYLDNNNKPNKIKIPIELKNDTNSEDLNLLIQNSILNIYDDSFSYEIKGYFYDEENEVHYLEIVIEGYDHDGKKILTDYLEIITQYDTYVYPNEMIPFSKTIFKKSKPPKLKKVVFTVYMIKKNKGLSNYPADKELSVEWETDKPANMDIKLYERESKKQKGFDTWYQNSIFKLKNTGKRDIKNLEITIIYFDKNNEQIKKEQYWMVSSTGPSLKPKHIIVKKIITDFPEEIKEYEYYKVYITEIE